MTKITFSRWKRLVLFIIGCTSIIQPMGAQQVIPALPASTQKIKIVWPAQVISEHKDILPELELFQRYCNQLGIPPLKAGSTTQQALVLKLDQQMAPEAYAFKSLPNGSVELRGRRDGVFRGLMTCIQLMADAHFRGDKYLQFPVVTDQPAFKWRGMHLDVSRHFFPLPFVKKYIDILALHKMNSFHWHLTDDQGWRIEIKKYPLLTAVGSKRHETMVDKHFEPYIGDGTPVEGYYTQDEIKEVVQYAQARHIQVVPEIEMPGHAMAALAAYPNYSCFRSPLDVMTKWGVSEDVFCTKDSTLQFVKDILDEVCTLFPSQYIHIGGDEVPKTRWKQCASCQQRIRDLHLKDEHELQSYFISQIDQYLHKKGRQAIGWDEILEGGLAPHAAIMSWRGEEGGIAATRQKHPVVMSPGSHCYFDHYQGNRQSEPLAIGGFTPLEKVYSYFPVPEVLKPEEAKYILGAQGNLWTEYIGSPDHAEYMMLPRVCALAEVLWCGKQKPGYTEFKSRIRKHFQFLDRIPAHYSKAMYSIQSLVQRKAGTLSVSLSAPFPDGEIHYTLNGNEPNLQASTYQQGDLIAISSSKKLKARYFENNRPAGPLLEEEFEIHGGLHAQIETNIPPAEQYSLGGIQKLVDARVGHLPMVGSEWLGWSGKDPEITLRWDTSMNFRVFEISLLKQEESWIYLPAAIEIASSLDGKQFTSIRTMNQKEIQDNSKPDIPLRIVLTGEPFQFLRIRLKQNSVIPDGRPGAGSPPWLFISEILLN